MKKSADGWGATLEKPIRKSGNPISGFPDWQIDLTLPILRYADLCGLIKLWRQSEERGFLAAAHPSTTCEALDMGVEVFAATSRGELFRCVRCGHEKHADVNAAGNLLRRASGGSLWRVRA